MSELKDIKEYINNEYHSLCNNINRPRTRAAVANKKKLLNGALEDFGTIIEKLENSKLPADQWNRLTDQYTSLQAKVSLAIKILNNSETVPNITNRSDSENSVKFEISEEDLKDLERSVTFIELPFSSTLIEPAAVEEAEINDEKKSYSVIVDQLNKVEEQFIKDSLLIQELEDDTNSFAQHLENLKKAFYQNSFSLQNILIKKMAFPMTEAIQCIPEFRGSADELESFLNQISHFARKIPENAPHDELLNVVFMKMKDKAATFINRVKARTWEEVKLKLQEQFQFKITVEEVAQKIETLQQGHNESFKEYADRALRIFECIEALGQQHGEQQASYAEKSLKIHFIGGLRNQNLKQAAKANRPQTFKELIKLLNEVYIECEQLEDIEQRLQSCQMTRRTQQQDDQHRDNSNNQNSDQRNYNRNQNLSNNNNQSLNRGAPRNNYNQQRQQSYRNYDNRNNQNGNPEFRRYNQRFNYNQNSNREYNQGNSFNRNTTYNENNYQNNNRNYNQNYDRNQYQNREYNQNNRGYNQNRNQGQNYQENQYYNQNHRQNNNYNRDNYYYTKN